MSVFYSYPIIYPINFSYKSQGSKGEKKLIDLFYNLEKKDHKNETDLMIDLLRYRYGLYVPEDLIQVAKDEILDPNYYKMSKKKKVQAGIKTAYKIDFWRLRMNQRRNWAFYGLTFEDYVEKRVMKEERLGPKSQITFERLANFFEHREGMIRHPRSKVRYYNIDIYSLSKKYHDYIHKLEDKIDAKLNVIRNDYCCIDKKSDGEDDDGPRPTYPPDPWHVGTNYDRDKVETISKSSSQPDDNSVDGDSMDTIDGSGDVAESGLYDDDDFGLDNNEVEEDGYDLDGEDEEDKGDFGFDEDDDW